MVPVTAANRAVPLAGLPGTTGSSVAGSNHSESPYGSYHEKCLPASGSATCSVVSESPSGRQSWPEKKP